MCMLHKKRFLSRKCRAPFSQLLKVPVLLSHCLFVLCWIMQCQPDTRMHVNQMTGDNLSFGEHRRHNAFSTNLTVCTNRQTIWMFFIFESTFYVAVFPLICDCITDFHWRIVPSVGVNCNLRDICTEQHSIEYEFMGACNTRCVCPERVIDHFRTVIENVELVCFFFLPLALRTKRAMQYMNEQLVGITDLEMESVPTIKENSKLCCCKSNNNDQDQQQKKQKYKNARWPMHTSWPKCISFHYYIEPGHTCNSNTFRWTTDWFTTAVFMLMVMLSSFVHVPPFVCVHCTFCIRLFFSTSFFCFDNYRCSFLLLLAI